MPGASQYVKSIYEEWRRNPTFLEENAFEQRVLVSKHETLIGGGAVALLKSGESFLILLDGCL